MEARRRTGDGASETLHELANSLAAMRLLLSQLDRTPAAKRDAILPEVLAKLSRIVGEAEGSCDRLRELAALRHTAEGHEPERAGDGFGAGRKTR
jgi:hypothetical protein